MQQHAPQVQTPEQQLQMDAAFDQAFKDAQLHMGQDQAQANEQEHEQAQPQELQQEEAPAEEIREAKGDFEKVWESLKPEAERLGKLAEWEKEFSILMKGSKGVWKGYCEHISDGLRRADAAALDKGERLERPNAGATFGFLLLPIEIAHYTVHQRRGRPV
jgi:peroxin-5